MEGGSSFVEHSAVANAVVAVNSDSRSATLGSTAGIGDAGQAIGDATDSKRRWRFRAHAKRRPVANPMRKSKSKFIQSGGIECVCPSQSACVLLSSANCLACGPHDNVIADARAVIRVKRTENVIVLRKVQVNPRVEPVD